MLSSRRAALFLVALFVAACSSERPPSSTPAASVSPSPAATPTPKPTPKIESLNVERVMDHVRALSVEIGLRNSGSNGDEKAAKYIAERFAQLTWIADRRAFPLPQGGESWNVVGTRSGFDESKPYVLVGAHYDSLNGPGANDNATGVGVILEIARVIAAKPSRLPIVVVAFGAEERQPFPERRHHVGSRFYVDRMSEAARRNLVAMVNVDMVGHGDVMQCPRMSTGPLEGAERCVRLGTELGIAVKERVTPDWSDNGSFLRAGMNAAWVWAGDYPCCYHNPKDTIDIVRRGDLERAGKLALALVRSYSR